MNFLDLTPKYFNTTDSIGSYVSSENYNINGSLTNPPICFGFGMEQISQNEFSYTLRYFDNRPGTRYGIQNIPTGTNPSWSIFTTLPDTDSFNKWERSGYIYMMKIINDLIFQTTTNNPQNKIDLVIAPQKFNYTKDDPFSRFIGFLVPFFIVIAYLFPLIIIIFRMIKEKETRVKEGMKIMGLTDSAYFFSWFFHYLILNTFYAVFNSLILTRVFTYVSFGYLFLIFFLYGMTIFSLGYFFQAIIDKTRIAMIISILCYFIMYFVSVAVLTEDVQNIAKMFISLLPPTCLQLGIVTLAKFEQSFLKLDGKKFDIAFQNYSMGNFITMLVVDIFVYLFLGFYLQNVITQQFGVKKPWYFLCTKKFWGFKSTQKISSQIDYNSSEKDEANLIMNKKDRFQDEENLYGERIKNNDLFKVSNLVKNFGTKNNVVDGVNLNFYKDEIFALLGHNGAGKTTFINILTGIYEKTSGDARYKNLKIFENMEEYRRLVGICPQHDVLFDQLTVTEHLRLFSIFKGATQNIESDIKKIIDDLELTDKANSQARTLSGGQKRKLSIGIALIGGSEIVFLDEPSSGMDITSRRKLWDILKRCTHGRIIILTTHYMEEAAVLGKRIGILSSGKMKCLGTPLFLIDKFGKYLSVNVIKKPGSNQDSNIINFFQSKIENVKYDKFSEEILFRIPKNNGLNKKQFFNELDNNLDNLGIKTYGASMPTLEDVFLNLSAETKELNDSKEIINPVNENKANFSDYDPQTDHIKSGTIKFFIDIRAIMFKRFLQIIRDRKSFLLEFLCPILLVLIGCGVSSITFDKMSESRIMDFSQLPNPQNIFVNTFPLRGNNLNLQNYLASSNENFYKFNFTNQFNNPTGATYAKSLMNYNDYVTKLVLGNSTEANNFLGSYFIFNINTGTNNQFTQYEVGVLPNSKSQDAVIIFTQEILSNLISKVKGQTVKIKVKFYIY